MSIFHKIERDMLQHFHYKDKILHAEELNLMTIAEKAGTPTHVYSRNALQKNWQAFSNCFEHVPHRICYAVKANGTLAILNVFAKLQAGFDIVSAGELERVIAAKGDAKKVIFSGVAKKHTEIERAIEVGVGCFNVESESELRRLHQIAKEKNKRVPIAIRINPDIDARTHPYIATGLSNNKFGIAMRDVVPLYKKIKSQLPFCEPIGIACHIGSQLTELDPFIEAVDCVLGLVDELKSADIFLKHIDIGGGLGIRYQNETPPSISDYVKVLCDKLKKSGLEIVIEPGRALVADTGILLTRVEYIKETPTKSFAIVDAGMTELLRPALYSAFHPILPVMQSSDQPVKHYEVVGPVCESADFLGANRELAIKEGDLLAIGLTGAYGACMSSTYNARPKAAEVMVDNDKMHIVRAREKIHELFAQEVLLP